MIKYSDKGLVRNGKVSPLFDQLYVVFTATFLCLLVVFTFVDYLMPGFDHKSRHIVTRICLNLDVQSTQGFSSFIGLSLAIVCILQTFITYVSSIYFYKKRTTDGRAPKMFGRYRRNVYTYNQTMIIGFFQYFEGSFVLLAANYFSHSPSTRFYIILHNLILPNFIMGFLLPLYILYDLKSSLPDFYFKITKPKSVVFHIYSPTLEPRRPEPVVEENHHLQSSGNIISISSENNPRVNDQHRKLITFFNSTLQENDFLPSVIVH